MTTTPTNTAVAKSRLRPDSIATAEAEIRREKEALAALLGKRAKIDADTLSFQSVERDQSARPSDFATNRRRLAAVRVQLAALRQDELGLSAEISAQNGKVAAAEAALRRLHSAASAAKVKELLPALLQHGAALDAAVATVVAEYAALKAKITEIRSMSGSNTTDDLGHPTDPSPAPSGALVAVSMRNALLSALAPTDLRIELLPPHARHGFRSAVAGWVATIERWCARCLGKPAPPEPAPPDEREAALPGIIRKLAMPYRPPPDDPSFRHSGV
ncbi:MAG TPA: hypothetical protein VNW89_08950 [Stellaceae bacterium]|jgi:hypothetical protein|nr:hypothetical protein [Stellaceae bacterium]